MKPLSWVFNDDQVFLSTPVAKDIQGTGSSKKNGKRKSNRVMCLEALGNSVFTWGLIIEGLWCARGYFRCWISEA